MYLQQDAPRYADPATLDPSRLFAPACGCPMQLSLRYRL